MPVVGASLEELIALNDEVAALVRAGVPLDRGLSSLSGDLPGRLGLMSLQLARHLQRGESLAEALEKEGSDFPPVYRAVVEAGLRCGRLSAALESIASSAKRLADARRVLMLGFVYPVLVCLAAWCVFVFFTLKLAPVFLVGCRQFNTQGVWFFEMIVSWGASAQYWAPTVPGVALVTLLIWWILAGRAGVLQATWSDRLLGWLPWIGSTIRSFRMATFSELLAMLVENNVPLDEAAVLAGEAVGDPRTMCAATELAGAIAQGKGLDSATLTAAGFFPLFGWMMASGNAHGMLGPALRRAAEIYYRRGMGQAQSAQFFLPILLTVGFGGTATLLCALLMFSPWLAFTHAATHHLIK
jgi:type II secretory pathway component PulF